MSTATVSPSRSIGVTARSTEPTSGRSIGGRPHRRSRSGWSLERQLEAWVAKSLGHHNAQVTERDAAAQLDGEVRHGSASQPAAQDADQEARREHEEDWLEDWLEEEDPNFVALDRLGDRNSAR